MIPDAETKNLSQCHSLHHKSLVDFSGNKPAVCVDKPSTNRIRNGTVCVTVKSKFIHVFNLTLDHEDARRTGGTAPHILIRTLSR